MFGGGGGGEELRRFDDRDRMVRIKVLVLLPSGNVMLLVAEHIHGIDREFEIVAVKVKLAKDHTRDHCFACFGEIKIKVGKSDVRV